MTHARLTPKPDLNRTQRRAMAAARWAVWVKLCLMALVFSAIWQERALAPSVHDRMQVVYGLGLDAMEVSRDKVARFAAMNVIEIGSR